MWPPAPTPGWGLCRGGTTGQPAPAPGGQLRAWHGRNDAPTLRTTALGARPHPIGNRYPTPTHRIPDIPPGGPLGLAGAGHHPVPDAHPVHAAPSARGRMCQRGLQPWAVKEAAARDLPGVGGSTPTPTGTFTAERSPPGHPHHVEQAQTQILHRRGTPRVPGDAGGERSPRPYPGTGRAGAWPGGQNRTLAQPAGSRGAPGKLWGVTALYIDQLKPLKLLNPSAEATGFIGAQPPCLWGDRQSHGLSPLGLCRQCQVGGAEARSGGDVAQPWH